MRKVSPLSIFFKLCALVSFAGLIGGGGYLAYDGYAAANWLMFGIGCGMVALGLFLTALFVTLFSRLDKEEDFADKPISHCFKGAGLFTFIAVFIAFLGVGILVWIDRGLWGVGVAAIICFVLVIVLASVISFYYQMEPMTKLKKDPQAIEMRGIVKSLSAKWTIILLKPITLIWKYKVEVNGHSSTAYCTWRDPLLQQLRCGDEVLVKIKLNSPKYCLITGKNAMPPELVPPTENT
ncbi:MAG: hypothetical protein K2G44_03195 [Clostridia bacterium]|nr:hypothetical protein [Clostridia bacterium]